MLQKVIFGSIHREGKTSIPLGFKKHYVTGLDDEIKQTLCKYQAEFEKKPSNEQFL